MKIIDFLVIEVEHSPCNINQAMWQGHPKKYFNKKPPGDNGV